MHHAGSEKGTRARKFVRSHQKMGGGKWDIVQGESRIHKEKYGSFRQTRTKIQKKRQILATRSKSDKIQRSGIIQPELSYHKKDPYTRSNWKRSNYFGFSGVRIAVMRRPSIRGS